MQSNFRFRRLSLIAAAVCAAVCPLAFAQIAPGALPSGWNVSSGSVTFMQNGSTLNINQTTPQALVNFSTFNVGSGALVDIRQPGATSALLARTTGGDPSQIYGQIKANGALWLINPAGIMIGAGARIDVGSFVASTLNVSDSDFLAGRLTFTSAGNAGAVHNAGSVNAASGGSIYLVAPSVVNTGTLNAPKGQVILAAGQNVQLVDTGTPGVSVSITGAQGEVQNLGRIAVEAGRIGLAAGLVSNSGSISADSAVSEGGRIFLRASADLKTTAASDISANGIRGGNVVLYASGAAAIDGRVSATGSAGPGGYVDTSGQRSLDVIHAPVVGKGGEWHIDPFSIQITAGDGGGGTVGSSAITSNETGANIGADTIAAQLNNGTSVSITTGGAVGSPGEGDITVAAPITKSQGADAELTLNARNNIVINADAPITSTSGALGLNLNSNYLGDGQPVSHAVQLNADMNLNGGVLNVSEGLGGVNNGTLNIAGGTTSLLAPGSAINAGAVNIATGATLAVGAGLNVGGAWTNNGNVEVQDGGALLLGSGTTWNNYGSVNIGPTGSAKLSLADGAGFGNKAGGALSVGDGSIVQLAASSTLTNDAGGSMDIASTATQTFSAGEVGRLINSGRIVKTGSGTVVVPLTNLAGGSVSIREGGLGANFSDANANAGSIAIESGATLQSGGRALYNSGFVGGSGAVALGGQTFFNNGIVAPGSSDGIGTLAIQGGYVQGTNGVLNIRLANGGSDLLDVDGTAQLGGTLNLSTLGGFVPAIGATTGFVVARGAGSGGVFRQVNAPDVPSDNGPVPLFVSYPVGGTTLARATAGPLPTLGACTANPALPGCASVLPTLDQCVANGSLNGCSAVLPTADMCAVSPILPGCPAPAPPASVVTTPTPAPPPSADICTIAPNSALCQVLAPPTASEPVKPVQQASNEVIKTVTQISAPRADQVDFLPAPNTAAETTSTTTSSGTADDKSAAKDTTGTTKDTSTAKADTVKKMYCN